MPSATTLFWIVFLAGVASFYDVFRRRSAYAIRNPRVKTIRLTELAVGLLYLSVILVWKWDFALFPALPWLPYAGVLLTAIGAGVLVWSKVHLKTNFTVTLGIKEDHQLVTSGPYALVRHPIYTAFLLEFIGAVLAYNSGATLFLLFLPFCILLYWQTVEEEKLLVSYFGPRYLDYRSRVGRLIPRGGTRG